MVMIYGLLSDCINGHTAYVKTAHTATIENYWLVYNTI